MNGRYAYIAAAMILIAACAAGASGRAEEEFSLQGIDSISVQVGPLDVEVIGEDTSTVTMKADIATDSLFQHRDFNVVHQQTGQRLKVWTETTRLFGSAGPGKLTFSVPRDAELHVQSVSGSITIQGMGDSTSTASTVSGELGVRDFSGSLNVKTVSGRLTMDDVEGRLDARSVSGRIRGTHIRLTSDSEFSTVSGDMIMRLDSPLDELRFDLSSISGSIGVGTIRTHRGLHMGFGETSVRGHTVSGRILFE